jgi:Acetyltransferase (GNAT) domain
MNDGNINFKEDKAAWDAFVATSPQRSIFVFSKFLDSLGTNYDLVTCYQKEKIVAGAVVIRDASGEPVAAQYPLTQYQGLLLADAAGQSAHSQITHEHKVVEYFLGELVGHYGKACFCQSWRFRDMRAFQWHNYHEAARGMFRIDLSYTGILDLTPYASFDDYVASVRAVRRQEYRKAARSLTLTTAADEMTLDALHDKTFQRQEIERPAHEAALVKSISRHALAGNYGKICCALVGDVPASAVLFLYDDRTAYYMFGANDPAYRNTSAGTLALMSMIKDAYETGIREIDFVGVNSPNRGDYKISFNPYIKPCFTASFG